MQVLKVDLSIFYCQIYTIGLNISFTTSTFRRDIRTLLFGDSEKDQAQNLL
jgi:hypothetical protein